MQSKSWVIVCRGAQIFETLLAKTDFRLYKGEKRFIEQLYPHHYIDMTVLAAAERPRGNHIWRSGDVPVFLTPESAHAAVEAIWGNDPEISIVPRGLSHKLNPGLPTPCVKRHWLHPKPR